MKIIKSPLQQISFWMIRFEFKIRASENPQKASDLFPKYEVELDFGVKEEDQLILIYTKVSINQGENGLPGYSIFAEGITRFSLSDLKARDKINIPCINIAIQNLRNHIASVTSDCQLGKYRFPIVNLGEMIGEKRKNAIPKLVVGNKLVRRRKIRK